MLMLFSTGNVNFISDASKKLGLSVTVISGLNFLTGCGYYGIGVFRKGIMDYLGFEEGEYMSFAVYSIETTKRGTAVTQSASSSSSINIEPSND